MKAGSFGKVMVFALGVMLTVSTSSVFGQNCDGCGKQGGKGQRCERGDCKGKQGGERCGKGKGKQGGGCQQCECGGQNGQGCDGCEAKGKGRGKQDAKGQGCDGCESKGKGRGEGEMRGKGHGKQAGKNVPWATERNAFMKSQKEKMQNFRKERQASMKKTREAVQSESDPQKALAILRENHEANMAAAKKFFGEMGKTRKEFIESMFKKYDVSKEEQAKFKQHGAKRREKMHEMHAKKQAEVSAVFERLAKKEDLTKDDIKKAMHELKGKHHGSKKGHHGKGGDKGGKHKGHGKGAGESKGQHGRHHDSDDD